MQNDRVLGIDMGGTHVRVGHVDREGIGSKSAARIDADGSEQVVFDQLCALIDEQLDSDIGGIGIGVPSVVDVDRGIVYDVQNIPSWKEVHLRSRLEKIYSLPVFVNNDANCFAMGEKYFGEGRETHSMIGLITGTGFGAGIIVNGRLYTGSNCGAGEFGMIPYRDSIYEYYCSGQFFSRYKGNSGEHFFNRAQAGDKEAEAVFREFGEHMGNGIKTIMHAYDPQLIVLGGSVRRSFDYFEQSMWNSIEKFTYGESVKNLKIAVSELDDVALLGAAALCYEGPLAALSGND